MRIVSKNIPRIALAASTAVLAALALAPGAASAATTHAWAQDGFDAGNTGFNPNETTINRTNAASLNNDWSITSPVVRGACGQQAPPIVAGGRLFLTDQGGFAAYSAATGAKQWSVRFADPVDERVTGMAAVGTMLIVATMDCQSVSDPDGRLTAYNVAGGAVVWSVFRDAPMTSIVVDQGVIVGVGGDAAANVASGFRVSDGVDLWDIDGAVVAASAVSAAGRVLLNAGGGTEAVNITTGAVLWSTPNTWLGEAATPDGSRFVVSTSAGDLLEVSAANGSVAWTTQFAGGPAAVDNTQVYAVHGQQLNAFNSSTGAFRWGKGLFGTGGKPIVAGGVVYVIGGGDVSVINSANGNDVDFAPPYRNEIGHVVVENGRLYVTTGRVLDEYAP